MRLTKYEREAFVLAVMNDVPQIDYQEQVRIALQKWAIDRLPPKVRALQKEFGHILKTDSIWNLPESLHSVFVITDNEGETKRAMQADAEFWKTIEGHGKALGAQRVRVTALQAKVEGLANSCSTTKQLRERAPEFAKYLPDDESPSRSLPVV